MSARESMTGLAAGVLLALLLAGLGVDHDLVLVGFLVPLGAGVVAGMWRNGDFFSRPTKARDARRAELNQTRRCS